MIARIASLGFLLAVASPSAAWACRITAAFSLESVSQLPIAVIRVDKRGAWSGDCCFARLKGSVQVQQVIRPGLPPKTHEVVFARACGSGGPDPQVGVRYVAYLSREGATTSVYEWETFDLAMSRDPHVAAALAAVPEVKRRRLVHRALEVEAAGGAIPVGDPHAWFTRSDVERFLAAEPRARVVGLEVRVAVDMDGRISDCDDTSPLPTPPGFSGGQSESFELFMCSTLRQRAQFERPELPQERQAVFGWTGVAAYLHRRPKTP